MTREKDTASRMKNGRIYAYSLKKSIVVGSYKMGDKIISIWNQ